MPIKISKLQIDDEPEWDAYVRANRCSTVYHTLAWRDVMRATYGFQEHYLTAKSDGRIYAVLPALIVRGVRGKRLVSMPMRDRGGIISESELHTQEVCRYLKEMVDQDEVREVILKADESVRESILEAVAMKSSSSLIRTALQLPEQLNQYEICIKNTSAWRAIAKSCRENVEVKISDEEKDWKEFYEMFIDTRRRLGIPPYQYKLFHNIRRVMVPNGSAMLLMAKIGQKNIGGMIFFIHNGVVIYAYGASRSESWGARPNDRLIYEAIKWAIGNGSAVFDFGSDSLGQNSLMQFKKKWKGTSQISVDYHITKLAVHRSCYDLDSGIMRGAQKIIRKIPRGLYKQMSWITGYWVN